MSRLDDGFATLVEFAEAASVQLFEKEVTPPGFDGGGANDTSTMRNTAWRTKAPKHLKSLSEMVLVASYDPVVYDDVTDMVNVNQLITVFFPDGSTVAFWGWLNEFKPNACKEGEQPTAQVTIIPSNQDSNGDEVAPVYSAAA